MTKTDLITELTGICIRQSETINGCWEDET